MSKVQKVSIRTSNGSFHNYWYRGSPKSVFDSARASLNLIGIPGQSHGTCRCDMLSIVADTEGSTPASDGSRTPGNSSSGRHHAQSPRPGRLVRFHGCLNPQNHRLKSAGYRSSLPRNPDMCSVKGLGLGEEYDENAP
ncbi:hypothetical protein RUND412_002519 [Rhizina undulata]